MRSSQSAATRSRRGPGRERPLHRSWAGWSPDASDSSPNASSPSRPSGPWARPLRPGAWRRCCGSSSASAKPEELALRAGPPLSSGTMCPRVPGCCRDHYLAADPETERRSRVRIAQVAPLFESVPPRRYGGTERVVSYLTEELVRQGHRVTLFAAGGSRTTAELVEVVERPLRGDPHWVI